MIIDSEINKYSKNKVEGTKKPAKQIIDIFIRRLKNDRVEELNDRIECLQRAVAEGKPR